MCDAFLDYMQDICKLPVNIPYQLNFTCQPDGNKNCMFLSVIHVCLAAVGGQARGKTRLPT
jgi:hypothetical protein